jgi:hypothetical protein
MQYPIEITEHPHRGAPRTWTLWDYSHLMRCIDFYGGQFEEWANDEGLTHWHENDDGQWELMNYNDVYIADNFIDFLRRDLKKIDVREVE